MRVLVFLVLLVFCSTCYAELYVLVDKDTKEILTVSEKDDTLPGLNQEIKTLPGSLDQFTDENPTNYKLSGTKFIKNIAKIDAQEQKKVKDAEVNQEELLIAKKMRQQAIDALKAEGVVFKYADKEGE
ncbi:MAG TPA: hypothetical protein DCL42_04380 [Deltaproteobacteria bacterium]|nr:hypothetical protein [Deltaproteobacteria bacterium]